MLKRSLFPRSSAHGVQPYLAMALLVVLCAFLQYLGRPLFELRAPLGLLYIPVMVSAVVWGWRPALLASVLLLLASPLFLLAPEFSFDVERTEDAGALVMFALVCAFTCVMGGLLERSSHEAHTFLTSLQEREQTFHALLESSTQAVLGIGGDGKIRFASESVATLFGYSPHEVIGQSFEMLIMNGLRQLRGHEITVSFDGGAQRLDDTLQELQCRKKDGSLFPAEASLRIIEIPSGQLAVTYIADITERLESAKQILHAARHDPLTGLPNRALVYELGTHLMQSAKRNKRNIAILFFDLDRFKPINDTYGHAIGDKMLQQVAHRLRHSLRDNDLVGRFGGDEFVAVLDDVHGDEAVLHAALHLLHKLSAPYHIDSLELKTSPSIGISLYPNDGKDLETLIRHADVAMYHAKNTGRNTCQFFTHEFNLHAKQSYELEQCLRHSTIDQDFELLYQPLIDLQKRKLVGVEALLRWRLADANGATPARFIAAAERCGLINQLGDWVLQESCRQHEKWRHLGLPALNMAVNVSALQFGANDYCERVGQTIKQCGVNPACIELELTETIVMNRSIEVVTMLDRLKHEGVSIALDDFGTGYSSLSYLSRFPINKLKIDQSFIKNIDTDMRSLAIAETVIALGKKLGMTVVAEGIESQSALILLGQIGCDIGQGYFISKPVHADRLVEWYYEGDYKQLLV